MNTVDIRTKVDEVKHSIVTLIKITGMTAAAGSYALKLIDIVDDLVILRDKSDAKVEARLIEELDFMILSPIEAIYEAICEDKKISKIDGEGLTAFEHKSKIMEELQKIIGSE